jgi:hypothetical protein
MVFRYDYEIPSFRRKIRHYKSLAQREKLEQESRNCHFKNLIEISFIERRFTKTRSHLPAAAHPAPDIGVEKYQEKRKRIERKKIAVANE